ncbi:UxaA family hydrolase [Haloarcula nitratireducens]|uniref:UxaA family hydrolase n=1 Tax=Haloarcula nitratireducens TaxID=2487749 RepID=A0AAW4PHK9_9EURY|nr:UxaA family hydrolase [Halomicroarcula nitratireducens]MBX0297424.1 UxaA family hydrolase [Halomicroarcula nitratireducens]
MVERHVAVVEPSDNVATVLRDMQGGESIELNVGGETKTIEIAEDIGFGHKFAIQPIPSGETITKYGKSIGNATEDIEPGDRVHVHNVESNYGRGDLAGDDQAKVVSE